MVKVQVNVACVLFVCWGVVAGGSIWLSAFRDDMQTALPRLRELVQDLLSTQEGCDKLSTQLTSLNELKNMLAEAQQQSDHAVYSLQERYS